MKLWCISIDLRIIYIFVISNLFLYLRNFELFQTPIIIESNREENMTPISKKDNLERKL